MTLKTNYKNLFQVNKSTKSKLNMEDLIKVPIIVRLQGTNADIAKELIDNSGLDVESAVEFQEAADKVQAVLI